MSNITENYKSFMLKIKTKLQEIKEKLEKKKKIKKKKRLEKKENRIEHKIIKRDQKKENCISFTKKIVLFIIIISEIEILLSYLLAFMGMINIAESLSTQVVITCLGGLGFYCLKALVENIFKYNNFSKDSNQNNNYPIQDIPDNYINDEYASDDSVVLCGSEVKTKSLKTKTNCKAIDDFECDYPD